MPLIIITGFPCSGKTYRSEQLISDFSARISSPSPTGPKRSIVHIPSQHSSYISAEDTDVRNTIYNSAALEKTARAAEFSAIKRALGKDVVVITDSLNYIKGYRYQLWCEAKAAGTRCCVVHVAAREEECTRWNETRLRDSQRKAKRDSRVLNRGETGQDGKKLSTAVSVPAYGQLMPESHTAVYGDRPAAVDSTSSDLWIKKRLDVDGELADDTFTLTSLSLLDQPSKPREREFIESSNTNPESTVSPTSITKPSTSSSDDPTIHGPSNFPVPSPPYDPQTLLSLVMRYEPPSPFSRWDTPLFTIPSSDPSPPFNAIWDAIFPRPTSKSSHIPTDRADPSRNPGMVKPHAATVLPASTSAEALQILERVTSEMTAQIHSWNPDEGGDVKISISGSSPSGLRSDLLKNNTSTHAVVDLFLEVSIPLGTVVTQPMLQRLRRRFIQIQRGSIAHGQGYAQGRKGVAEAFCRFLNGEFGG